MRVVQVNALLDPSARAPVELLDAWPTLEEVAVAVARAGAKIAVVQAAHVDERIRRKNVSFEFVDATRFGAIRIAQAVARREPDVVHLHGLAFTHQLLELRKALPGTPLLVQDHADGLPRRFRRGWLRRALREADGLVFTARAQAKPFVRAGVLSDSSPVFEVPESSTHFRTGDAAAARAALRVHGDPCVVWIGRLNANKDPLTALRGFANTAKELPDARLWMCHDDAPMLAHIRRTIERDAQLRERVQLLRALPHAEVELLLIATDLFLSTSLRESTGYALIEALACGAMPAVSDIPSFRALLADGLVGALFPCGDAAALARALVTLAGENRTVARKAARSHFDERLSFAAVGQRLVDAYESVLAQRKLTGDVARTLDTGGHSRARPRRLRIALVVPGGVDRSGTQRVIPCLLWLIERLAREVELHVLALRQEEHVATYPLLGAAVHCLSARTSRPGALRWLLEQDRVFGFDLWHAIWMHPQGTLAAAAGALTRRPVLLHLNGGDLTALPEIAYGGRATARGRAWLRTAVAGATCITVPSEAMRRAAADLRISAEVVTFGVALDRWPARAPRRRRPDQQARLLHVANLNRVKDQHTLLRALALLQKRGLSFHVDVIGEDTLEGMVQKVAGALELDRSIQFHGALPHQCLRPFFDAAHVLLISSRHEADPIVALEAAIAGVPTVGTPVGHLVDWAPEAAVAVPVGNAAALAEGTATLLADDRRRREIAGNAQRRALAMDADAGATRVLELYETLTAGRR